MKRTVAAGAVALGLVGGGVALAGSLSDQNPTDALVFVAIDPCRLLDTRDDSDDNYRVTPLTAGGTMNLPVTGSWGQCVGIPAGIEAISLNVTAVNGTKGSFLTIYPNGVVTRPIVSSLNWTANSAPDPNAVTVKVGVDDKVKFYNHDGLVDVVVDVVGYYELLAIS